MYAAILDGIAFIEGAHPQATPIRELKVTLNGVFTQAQLKNLDDVKRQMAQAVREASGNCVINFKYGQRTTFWGTLFGLDNVHWYGSGVIARIPDRAIAEIAARR